MTALNNMPRVRLAPHNSNDPKNTRMPLAHSLRWYAMGVENRVIQPALAVFVTQPAYVRICAHAGSDLDNEVGGWMAGKRCIDKSSGAQFIIIDTILPAEYTERGPAHLTFTGDSQVTLHNLLQAHFPGKVLVGWYHTHPRMGVFLSEWDIWLHQNFFPEKWQVALVIEPHSSFGGFFIRQKDGKLDTHWYYGFYEILGRKRRSVVFWQNLQPYQEIEKESG